MANARHSGVTADESERMRVVAAHEGVDLCDAGGARVGDELAGERGADAAMLVLVRNGEGDLRVAVGVAREAGDRDGKRIPVDVADERVMVRVDPRKLRELQIGEAGLRPVEAHAPRFVAEPVEDRPDCVHVAVPKGPNEEAGAALRLDQAGQHGQ